MKRIVLLAAAAALIALPMSVSAGNGAPSGKHYQINIIGVENPKKASLTDTSRRTIFVPLNGNCKINLSEGSFAILDGNCFDGNGARFQLPDPEYDGTYTAYSVYARALGTPGGSARMTSCYEDLAGDEWCSVESVVLVRNTGKSTFTNVSKELLTLCIDTFDDGNYDGNCDVRSGLFDYAGYEYWWDYANTGLRLAQLRFYEIPTQVN